MLALPPIVKPLLRKKLTLVLLTLQIALITMLVSNMAHVLNEINSFYKATTGIDDHHLISFTLRVPPEMKGILLADGLRDLETIKAIPGVVDVASMDATPFDERFNLKTGSFTQSTEQDQPRTGFVRSNISPNALTTMGLKLLAGRQFDNSDMAFTYKTEPRVIIITQAMAKALYGENSSAVGRQVYENGKGYEIIGVTADWRGFNTQMYRSESTVFFPEYNEVNKEFRYLVRTKSPEVRTQVIQAVEQYIADQYPQGLIFYSDKLDSIIAKYKNYSTINLLLMITLVLSIASIVAISGQAYFSVHQRKKQLGVLRALGATRGKLIAQILLENSVILLIGLGLGIVLALLVSQLIYQTSDIVAISPGFLVVTAASIFTVCLLSATVPAWQAGKISPSLATRTL